MSDNDGVLHSLRMIPSFRVNGVYRFSETLTVV